MVAEGLTPLCFAIPTYMEHEKMELIPVSKNGEYIEVHPIALAQHKNLGWQECEKQEAEEKVPHKKNSKTDH